MWRTAEQLSLIKFSCEVGSLSYPRADIEMNLLRDAFNSDALVGVNLTAVGTYLLGLPVKLTAALDLEDNVRQAMGTRSGAKHQREEKEHDR